jgi:drug/metabolite transporter (DMT)-like permease
MSIASYQTKRIVAFAAIYLLWGGSYFAIRSVVSVLPPMFAASLRYCLGGAILLAISFVVRERSIAGVREAANCCLVGLVMIVAGYALIYWSSSRLQSWIVAVLVSTSSLWTYMGECFVLGSQRPRAAVLIPLLAGLAGIPVLCVRNWHGSGLNSFAPAAGILVSSVAWSVGTLALKRLRLPGCLFQSAGLQLGSAGLTLAAISWGLGDWRHLALHRFVESVKPILGMTYLVLCGSVVAFSAYHWLMRRESPTRVATFAYVNPIAAMILGIGVAHEQFSGAQMIAAVAILASVIQVWRAQPSSPSGQFEPSISNRTSFPTPALAADTESPI